MRALHGRGQSDSGSDRRRSCCTLQADQRNKITPRLRVQSHVRFVRNLHGLLHFLLVTFQQEWSHGVRCSAYSESGKKVAVDLLSKTSAATAAPKMWFAKLPLDYMLHNRVPWKRCCRPCTMWPPCSLWLNWVAAACRPYDRSFRLSLYC